MNTPPPLDGQPAQSTFFHKAANVAIISVPVSLALSMASGATVTALPAQIAPLIGFIMSLLCLLLLLIGMGAAVVSLFGIPKHGTRGILVKALCSLLIPVILIALAIPTVLGALERAKQLQAAANSTDGFLSLHVEEINKKTPIMVDDDTRADSAELLPDRTIAYNYTTVKLSRKDVPPDVVTTIIRPGLVEVYKNSPDMKPFRDEGVTLIYRYKDRDGELLGETTVGPGHLD